MRAQPAEAVVAWVSAQAPASVCTTAVTLAEIRYGIGRLPDGRRKDLLADAADDVFTAFSDRVLSFDAGAAVHYADVLVEREGAGLPIAGFDAQIAAICRHQAASLATRNLADFDRLGLRLINPWG